MKEEEKEVIKRAISGDQEAYSLILRSYRDAVFGLVYRIIRDREEADDITQETFIRAFKSLRYYTPKYALSTWLFRIATNRCIDHLRKRKIRTISLDQGMKTEKGELRREIPDTSSRPDELFFQKRRVVSIEQAIGSLPPKYKEVIYLKHNEERTYEEIAQILNLPLGTVKVRIFRTRELLKKKLKSFL